jgi:hypothetical protein
MDAKQSLSKLTKFFEPLTVPISINLGFEQLSGTEVVNYLYERVLM